MLTALAALYATTAQRLVRYGWPLTDYSHAPFILPVALWLAWRKLPLLRAKTAEDSASRSNAAWFFVLLAGLWLFHFGNRQEYLSVATFAAIPILFGAAGFVFGSTGARTFRFPILYLLFLVPPPLGVLDSVTLPLRHFASAAAFHVLRALNYPIERQGLLLNLGGHDIFLGEPCSGLRSLVTLMALGLVYIHLCGGAARKNAILIAMLVPLALAGNLLRVILLSLITYHLGPAAVEGWMHEGSGLLVFFFLLIGLVGLQRLFEPRGAACRA